MTTEPFVKKGDYLVTRELRDYRTRVEDGKWTLLGIAARDLSSANNGNDRITVNLLEKGAAKIWPPLIEQEDVDSVTVPQVTIEHMPSAVCAGVPRMQIVGTKADLNLHELRELLLYNGILHSDTAERVRQFMRGFGVEGRTRVDRDFFFHLSNAINTLPQEEVSYAAYFLEQLLRTIHLPYRNNSGR